MNEDKEIFFIINTAIKDKAFKDALSSAILNNKGNVARIMTEELVDSNRYNKSYKRLDDLVTNKFFG